MPQWDGPPEFLGSSCLRWRFGSSFTPPQFWGFVHESQFHSRLVTTKAPDAVHSLYSNSKYSGQGGRLRCKKSLSHRCWEFKGIA